MEKQVKIIVRKEGVCIPCVVALNFGSLAQHISCWTAASARIARVLSGGCSIATSSFHGVFESLNKEKFKAVVLNQRWFCPLGGHSAVSGYMFGWAAGI